MIFFEDLLYKIQLMGKKWIFIILFIIFFVLIVLAEVTRSVKTEIKTNIVEKKDPFQTYESADGSFSLTLKTDYNLEKIENDKYILDLVSDKNLNIFIDKQPLVEGKSLEEVINVDKRDYPGQFNGFTNVSETSGIKVKNDLPAFTYSFEYFDANISQGFMVQIVWVQTNTGYYIFNMDFPKETLDESLVIINDILSVFEFSE